jgi:hypothetical protein
MHAHDAHVPVLYAIGPLAEWAGSMDGEAGAYIMVSLSRSSPSCSNSDDDCYRPFYLQKGEIDIREK